MKKSLLGVPAAALLLLAACDPQPPRDYTEDVYSGGQRSGNSTTAAVGDSMFDGGRADLHTFVGRESAVKISGVPGATFNNQLPTSETYAADKSTVALIGLGTNDSWRNGPALTNVLADLNRTYDLFAESCTVGVTVTTIGREGYDPLKAAAVNEATARRADEVVDWGSVSQQVGMTSEDMIHPTSVGYRRRAQMIADAVDECIKGVSS